MVKANNENEKDWHCRCDDLRCNCGRLLAKLTREGVIIRCPRCKREMAINIADLIVNLDTGWSEVSFKEKSI